MVITIIVFENMVFRALTYYCVNVGVIVLTSFDTKAFIVLVISIFWIYLWTFGKVKVLVVNSTLTTLF